MDYKGQIVYMIDGQSFCGSFVQIKLLAYSQHDKNNRFD